MGQQNAFCCPNDDDRGPRTNSRTSCHCGPFRWLCSPQTAFCTKWTKMAGNKTMNEWDDDNYGIAIQCRSVWTCFFLSVSSFLASWRNILRATRGARWETSVPQTPASAPPKTKSWIRSCTLGLGELPYESYKRHYRVAKTARKRRFSTDKSLNQKIGIQLQWTLIGNRIRTFDWYQFR